MAHKLSRLSKSLLEQPLLLSKVKLEELIEKGEPLTVTIPEANEEEELGFFK